MLADVLHRAAGLGHEGDRAGRHAAQVGVGIAEIPLAQRVQPHAVGPADHEPGAVDQRLQRDAARDDLGIVALAELGGIDGGALEPGRDAGLQHRLHRGRRHDHEGMRGRLRQRGEVGIALGAPDLAGARIDRIDISGKSVVAQVAIELPRPSRALGSADDGDRRRPEQGQRGFERDGTGGLFWQRCTSDLFMDRRRSTGDAGMIATPTMRPEGSRFCRRLV